jgi:hypothetical protein
MTQQLDNQSRIFKIAGWCAYLAAVSTIIGFFSIVIFFIVGDPFGKINDMASVVIALTSIPVLYVLYKLTQVQSPLLTLVVLILGMVAMIVASIIQSLLVLGFIPYEATAFVAPFAFGLLGLCVTVYSYFTFQHKIFSNKLSIWGLIAGIAYILVCVGFILGGQNHPFSYVGGLVAVIAFPIWAILVGRDLLKM